jgi:hypothetical protein
MRPMASAVALSELRWRARLRIALVPVGAPIVGQLLNLYGYRLSGRPVPGSGGVPRTASAVVPGKVISQKIPAPWAAALRHWTHTPPFRINLNSSSADQRTPARLGERSPMNEDEIERDVVRSATWQLMRRAPTWLLIAVLLGAAVLAARGH